MVNRTQPPSSQPIDKINLEIPQKVSLRNGMDLYYLNQSDVEILRLEILLPAGQKTANDAITAQAVNSLLLSGTSLRNSAEIAEEIDFYGAFVENHLGEEYAGIQVYTLRKHLGKVLETLAETLNDLTFPIDEVQTYKENRRQRMLVNEEKVSFLARRCFKEMLFGDKHPYGRSPKLSDIEALDRQGMMEFYRRQYNYQKAVLFAAGKIDEEVVNEISSKLEILGNRAAQNPPKISIPLSTSEKNYIHIPKKDAVQSAIRIGRVLFPKNHPDYMDFSVLNVLLGGYFGSRLMSNIREDKGYTYGISSGVVGMPDAGYFVIATEVGAKVTSAAIDEIFKELKRLREEKVSADELELVKNYMLGAFMKMVDGPFAQIDWYSGIYQHNLSFNYYENYLQAINDMGIDRIQELAMLYLREEDLKIVTSGSMAHGQGHP